MKLKRVLFLFTEMRNLSHLIVRNLDDVPRIPFMEY